MANRQPVNAQSPHRLTYRLIWVWAILVLAAIGLIVRLVYLQVWTAADLKERALRQQMYTLRPFIPRRSITDRNNTVLAVDKPVYALYAHPHLYKNKPGENKPEKNKSEKSKLEKSKPEEIAEKLSPILNRPIPELVKLLQQETTSVQIEYWMTEEVADRIYSLGIDGLDLVQQRHRYYPQQDLAADILGYVNVDHRGQAGVELSQEKLLERVDRSSDVIRDGRGKIIPSRLPAGMMRADRTSLQLTIDARLQRVARDALRQQMQKYGAKRGTVIVMDAKDGGLRTLVTEPTYDPNNYYKTDIKLFKNWAISDLYEPGSTFKPINVAIALETGAIKPDTVFNDEGSLIIGGWPVANFDYETAGPRGPLSISQILQHSSNVGMVHIVQQMKPSIYFGWLERLGLGDITGIDLPSETASTLKPQEQFVSYVIEPATAAFGQGFSLTPIQMAQLNGLIASGGKLLTPHVVKALLDEDGEVLFQPKINPPRQIFSRGTTEKVLEMMASVVQEGTGKPARIPGYRLGGKTGTAQKADPNGGGYSRAKITSFVGIFPAKEPRYVVMATIDEPVGDDAFGYTFASPIVKAVIEDIIVADKIPPSVPDEVTSAPIAVEVPESKPSPAPSEPASNSPPVGSAPADSATNAPTTNSNSPEPTPSPPPANSVPSNSNPSVVPRTDANPSTSQTP